MRSFFFSSGGGRGMNDSKNEAGLRIVGVQGLSSSPLGWGNGRPRKSAALRRGSPGPPRSCIKDGQSGVSPLPLWGGVMKDPENEAIFRIVIDGSLSFKSGMG